MRCVVAPREPNEARSPGWPGAHERSSLCLAAVVRPTVIGTRRPVFAPESRPTNNSNAPASPTTMTRPTATYGARMRAPLAILCPIARSSDGNCLPDGTNETWALTFTPTPSHARGHWFEPVAPSSSGQLPRGEMPHAARTASRGSLARARWSRAEKSPLAIRSRSARRRASIHADRVMPRVGGSPTVAPWQEGRIGRSGDEPTKPVSCSQRRTRRSPSSGP